MGTTNAGLNIATDIIVGILPLVMMRNVRLPTRAKLGVSFIFVLGSGTIVVAILRITLQAPKGTLDYTWELTCGAIASILETGLSVVCACIPVLRPFLRHVFPNTFYESYGASYYVDNSYGRGGSRQWNTSAAQKSGAIASRSWELGARSDAAQRAGTGDNIDEDIEKDSMNDTILGHQEKHAYLVHVSDHGLPGSSTELWPENLRNMNNESQGGAARLVISPSISPSEKRIMFLGKFGA
ncbi:MAG: hypothetical protein M1833_004739 [Piccolia ochrophora]|nr:MAG: hypothetical protein M1833_004739 [Piccolia ochrophora]